MSSPGQITVELMQQILRDVKKNSTIVVVPSLEVDELNCDFHGGGCVSRVTTKYNWYGDASKQHTLSLIVKVMMKIVADTSTFQQTTSFPREIQMFEEILPRVSSLLGRALGDRHEDFTPRVYYTRKSPNFLIAMEDLSPRGFKSPKRSTGLDLKHSLLAFRALARYHAATVMIQREDPKLLEVFDRHSFLAMGSDEERKKMTASFVTMVSQVVETWPEFGPSWAVPLRQRAQTLHGDLMRLLQRDDSRFNVLTHGDFGAHNVMYRSSETSGEAEGVMLVDFQLCSRATPALDMHHFIFSSASDEVRAIHVDTLLEEYHAELTTTLDALGSPRAQIISLKQLRDDFDSTLLYGFFCAIVVLPFIGVDLQTVSGVSSEVIHTATSDSIQTLHPLLTDSYVKSLKTVLPFFRNKKFI